MIKVLIVDDSAVVRQVVTDILEKAAGIKVIGAASDPLYARERMNREWPDVIVLDVEMPRMDGISFLKQLMAERPTPVVILSTLTTQGSETAIEALRAGAIQVLAKPSLGVRQQLQDDSSSLVQAVRAASLAVMSRIRTATAASPIDATASLIRPKLNADAVLAPPTQGAMIQTTERIVLLGTSTGGTQALEAVLTRLGSTCPPLAIVQHMPESFTASFARRLNELCQIEVREASNGERMRSGLALIAPGGKHLMIKRSGAQYLVEVVDGPLVSRHKPSVDVLFRSGAKFAGRNAIGIIMTGMGDDGARGLKEMHDAGARTYAQDEQSCVVFGMPKEAIRLGAADEVVPLNSIPGIIERRS
ncbi:protein-glutamate methylesterase/protein-glutamine glutaminase [Chitinilyticum piscinae]|uniref:Protein-glutamate methylesterase/protein-glutamine glutaminase n=1 Tax=Chitinilyticum piscinae TaxID=2866724 RepID=A0A8J7K276_9NEIS|nr:chemotaxis response regulator protein-glutamate methylesterase [Chitinilyticum piscinae]MBE9609652.1 chemotaxis response regulator protein-glutamate methylesterase [Chitinilyticum piscinae]